MARQQYLKGLIPLEDVGSPVCDYCQLITDNFPLDGRDPRPLQTVQHILTECEYFATQRLQAFGQAFGLDLSTVPLHKAMNFLFAMEIKLLPEDDQEVMNIDISNPVDDDQEFD